MYTNKPFENSQTRFTGGGKHCNGRGVLRSTMVIKCKRTLLYFKEDIVVGRFCMSVFVSVLGALPVFHLRTGNN